MESLGYLLLYFVRGCLPWQGIQTKKKIDKFDSIGNMKKTTLLNKLCEGYEGTVYSNRRFGELPVVRAAAIVYGVTRLQPDPEDIPAELRLEGVPARLLRVVATAAGERPKAGTEQTTNQKAFLIPYWVLLIIFAVYRSSSYFRKIAIRATSTTHPAAKSLLSNNWL